MHATMAWPLFEAHEPPGCGAGDGEGDGDGGGVGAAGVWNVCVPAHALVRLAIAGACPPIVRAARGQGGGDVRHLRGRIRQESARHDLRERHVHGHLNLVGHGADGSVPRRRPDGDRRRCRGDAFVVDGRDQRRHAERRLRQHFERGGYVGPRVGSVFRPCAPVVRLADGQRVEGDSCLTVGAGRDAAASEHLRLKRIVARHFEAVRQGPDATAVGILDHQLDRLLRVLELRAVRRLHRTRRADFDPGYGPGDRGAERVLALFDAASGGGRQHDQRQQGRASKAEGCHVSSRSSPHGW